MVGGVAGVQYILLKEHIMQRFWSRWHHFKLLALAGSSGILLAFPGCGTNWWDYLINAGAGFVTSQVIGGFVATLPQ